MKLILLLLILSTTFADNLNASYNFKLSKEELDSIAKKLNINKEKTEAITLEEQKILPEVEVKQAEAQIDVKPIETKVAIKEDNSSLELINKLKSENDELKNQINNLKRNVSNTEEARELKDRLAIAELEVERLSDLLNQKRDNVLLGRKAQPAPPVVERKIIQNPLLTEKQIEKTEADMQTLTVMADKVYLRINPGKDASPLMAVTKGNKLVVEKRVGEWYRVIAPNGTRAWISSDVVAFGASPNSAPTNTVKVAGFDSEIEDQAFKSIMGIKKE